MFNTLKAILTLVAIFLLAVKPSSAQNGEGFYSFLNIPSSTKIYGLGGINISTVDGGIESVEQNPALLGPEYKKNLGIGYMRYFGNSNFGSIAFGNAIREHNAWSVGIRYLGYGEIQQTDPDGSVTGSYSPIDFIASFSYSMDINDRLRGGVALKSVYSAYDRFTSFALAVDLGINYYDPERDLSLSATVVNLGGQLKRFDQAYERLPIDVRLGWTQSFPGLPIRFSITAWNLTKWNIPYVIVNGTQSEEFKLKHTFASNLFRHLVFAADIIPSEHFYFCLGYNYKVRTDMSSAYRNLLSGLYLGCGLNVGQWGIGIAYAQPHSGANTFMVNISTTLNQFLK